MDPQREIVPVSVTGTLYATAAIGAAALPWKMHAICAWKAALEESRILDVINAACAFPATLIIV